MSDSPQQTVLVTGASSGIGAATARAVARDGYRVICLDVADSAATAVSITSAGGSAESLRHDVASEDDWARLIKDVGSAYGLVAAAGISPGPDTVEDQTVAGWDRILDVNLKGIWLGMRAVIPGMKALGGGSIVNVSSLGAIRGRRGLAAYSAAKGGVLSLSRQAAVELIDHSIRVNSVLPGAIDTPLLRATRERLSADAKPLSKPIIGSAEEMAEVIAFLISSRASFVNGQDILVDGGSNCLRVHHRRMPALAGPRRAPRRGPARPAGQPGRPGEPAPSLRVRPTGTP